MLICVTAPTFAAAAYMITSSDQFGTVNLSTGAFTVIGTTEVGSTPVLLAGLGEVGGVLYGASDGSDQLYEINTATGALTAIGTSSGSYVDFGSTLTTLYAMDANSNLYTVNPATGVWTLAGATGLPEPGTSSFSTGSSTLYFNEFNSGYNLYTLAANGTATLVGSSTTVGALMWDGVSTLYGVQDSPNPVDLGTLNTGTGAFTVSSSITGASGNVFGLAPILSSSSTPEPGTFGLIGAALITFGVLRRHLLGRR